MKEQDVFPDRKKRTTYEQLSIMAESCKEPKNLTNLFYILEASYPQLQKILRDAIRLKLLRKTKNRYTLTEKGTEYLTRWKGLLKFLKETN